MGDQETQRLLAKLAEYNRHHEGKKRHLNSKMVNDRLVIEGLLQVYWGVKKPIQFKKGEAVMVRKKNHLADIINGFAEAGRSTEVDSRTLPAGGISSQETPASRPIQRERRGSLDDIDTGALAAAETVVKRGRKNKREIKKYNTIAYRGETATKKLKKRYTINGHFYNPKTSVFTPTHGTVTAVRVSSLLPVHDVIKLLLEKFKVENSPEEFALYIVKDNGETRKLEEADSPLITRVELGPDEDHIKLFIMEDSSQVITHEVAQYLNLPETVLLGIYKKFQEEEEKEVQRIKNWYVNYREALKRSMIDYQTYL
ncbi:ras association domain-containing protein 2 isoform X2 [Lingula anatina]|nr:ras association domain-containing protein 2 isoform X2 [Lingula anatina]XP_013386630.1 ras association domain-containing protein 2 isoform X2 [Lingula anatina]|eukprot:XP_013386629.1 ras association domain-containing protein 2 isoform X2 [Lingula anatina]